jgi:hypothetical protein
LGHNGVCYRYCTMVYSSAPWCMCCAMVYYDAPCMWCCTIVCGAAPLCVVLHHGVLLLHHGVWLGVQTPLGLGQTVPTCQGAWRVFQDRQLQLWAQLQWARPPGRCGPRTLDIGRTGYDSYTVILPGPGHLGARTPRAALPRQYQPRLDPRATSERQANQMASVELGGPRSKAQGGAGLGGASWWSPHRPAQPAARPLAWQGTMLRAVGRVLGPAPHANSVHVTQ